MEKITLNRTGDRPVEFTGEEIASADTREHQGPCQNRWWEIALYRNEPGKFVLAIGYRTQWQGEHPTDTVYVCDTAEETADAARAHPYNSGVSGFPHGHDERQARLEQMLRQCWEAGLTEILGCVGPEKI